MTKNKIEITMRWLLLFCSMISLLILVGIGYFLFKNGFMAFVENGVGSFIFGKTWNIGRNVYGLYPLILGSIFVTIGSIVVSAPMGISVAIFMTDIATEKFEAVISPCIELMAGIPSVVFGLVGMIFLVPLIRENFAPPGYSLIAAIIILIVMTIPTVITLSRDSLKSVPRQYKEASYALGATKWQTIWHHVIPASFSRILTGTILALSRALGETAPLVVIGAATFISVDPSGIFSKFTTLPIQIYQWSARPQGAYRNIAAAAIITLLVLLLVINSSAIIARERITRKKRLEK